MAEYWTYDNPNKDANGTTRWDGVNGPQLESLAQIDCLAMRCDSANVSTNGGGIALCTNNTAILYDAWTKYVDQAQGKIDFDALDPPLP